MALLAYLRALLCRDGIAEMRGDAQIAWEQLSPASPYRATMLHTEGISYLLEADPDRADPILAHAVDVAVAAGAVPLVALVLAERAIAATERGDWPAAQAFTEQALTIVRDGHFDDYWTSALVYAGAARIAAHRGDVAAGPPAMSPKQPAFGLCSPTPCRSFRPKPLSSWDGPIWPWATPSGVRAVLRQARDIFEQRPDLGVLPQQAAELRARLTTITAGAQRGILAHDCRATTPPPAVHPPHPQRDQRASLPLAKHREDPGGIGVPEVRRLLPPRRHRPHVTNCGLLSHD